MNERRGEKLDAGRKGRGMTADRVSLKHRVKSLEATGAHYPGVSTFRRKIPAFRHSVVSVLKILLKRSCLGEEMMGC